MNVHKNARPTARGREKAEPRDMASNACSAADGSLLAIFTTMCGKLEQVLDPTIFLKAGDHAFKDGRRRPGWR